MVNDKKIPASISNKSMPVFLFVYNTAYMDTAMLVLIESI